MAETIKTGAGNPGELQSTESAVLGFEELIEKFEGPVSQRIQVGGLIDDDEPRSVYEDPRDQVPWLKIPARDDPAFQNDIDWNSELEGFLKYMPDQWLVTTGGHLGRLAKYDSATEKVMESDTFGLTGDDYDQKSTDYLRFASTLGTVRPAQLLDATVRLGEQVVAGKATDYQATFDTWSERLSLRSQ